MQKKPEISVVIPVYGCSACLAELTARIRDSLKPVTSRFEIILVNDASPDDSWSAIRDLCKKNKRVKGVSLSRNFGQHHAITAGLDLCAGEWAVVMDCDLQDRPEEIPNLYNKAKEGYDIVLARRSSRRDSWIKKTASRAFYRILAFLTGSEQDETIANFGIYGGKVIREVVRLRESVRYFPTMVKWVGFKTATLDVRHAPRTHGKTSYNFRKMLRLSLDIILAYSDKPLRLIVTAGAWIAFLSILFGIFIMIKWFRGEIEVMGYASLITSLWFLSGVILATLGMTGLYIGKIFETVKNRPLYIVAEKINV
ncbi:glycosyltransferase family 2 protein [bacterium]|nr:glycosyltransferase family 2 protein [bacterium]